MSDFIEPQDQAAIESALSRLNRLFVNMRPLYQDIGEAMVNVTTRRFQTSTGPDGTRWEGNTEATMLAYLANYSGSYTKAGTLSKAGSTRVANKKPLIGASRALSTQIHYEATDTDLAWGSSMEYAAMMQFGGTKSEFPNLWGDIPARQFLGVNDADTHTILDLVEHYIEQTEPTIQPKA